MTAASPRRPSDFGIILLWLLLFTFYGIMTDLPVVSRVVGSGVEGPSASTGVPLQGYHSTMHLIVANRTADSVRVEERIHFEGQLLLDEDTNQKLDRAKEGLGRQLGQFFENDTLAEVYIAFSSGELPHVAQYRAWSRATYCAALATVILGMLWQIIVERRADAQKIAEGKEAKLWRLSTICGVVIVAALHSSAVYYQGGLMVSPVGLVATAIVPLLIVQVVVLWDRVATSWYLLIPVAVFVLGHWWAHSQARAIDPGTVEVMARRFQSLQLYVIVYVLGLGFGIASLVIKKPVPSRAPVSP